MRGRTRTMTLILLLSILFVTSCERKAATTSGWRIVPVEELEAAQKEQQQKALAARDAMFETLMNRLQQAIAERGVAGAVEVCSSEAPRIAEQIGAEKGLRIGRTSFKLRNPKNQPPEWASTLVAAKTTQPTTLVHSDGRLATLLPIHVKTQCLMCHGRDENIPDEVKSALKKHYPADAATGFAEGDLRGWFWVEVPARVR